MKSRRVDLGRTGATVGGMAAATVVSRATGFVRTLAIAWALGATVLGDAFNVANTAPNMIFQLAAGGVLSSAIVPILARATTDEERRERAAALYGLVLATGVVASAAVALGAPLVVAVLTAGAAGRPDHTDLAQTASTWLRWFAPQVVAYAIGVYAVAVMTHHRRLVLGAAASIITNVLATGGAIVFVVIQGGARPAIGVASEDAIAALGVATTAGVVAMAAVQAWGAHRVEPGLRIRLRLRDPAIADVRRVAPWVTLYVVVNQLGLAVVTALASSVPGGVSAYQWAFTVMQLPHAVIAVTVISAAFPRVAAAVAADESPDVHLEPAVRALSRVLVPAAAALAAVAPVLGVALVGSDGSRLVGAGVAAFAVGLVPFSLFQLGTRTSYAYQDARTPALVNIAVNVVNVAVDAAVIALVSDDALRVAGLAIGHATSYVMGVALLARMLARRRVRLLAGLAPFGRPLSAAVCVGAATALTTRIIRAGTQWESLRAVGAAAVVAAVVFASLAIIATRSAPRRRAA